MSLVGFYVAATVVTLMQFGRLRDRRLLPLLALFALEALAHSDTDWSRAYWFYLAAGFAGLGVLIAISHRPHAPHR